MTRNQSCSLYVQRWFYFQSTHALQKSRGRRLSTDPNSEFELAGIQICKIINGGCCYALKFFRSSPTSRTLERAVNVDGKYTRPFCINE